ncbi:MAG: hypothetical protein H0Z19_04835 [Archaeoglobus sp.]|uniref:hypothetical protein n=1 Tax=Archaeoglobus sp. TaxID=1872626 RepID=UPI001D53FEAC|nr:hypothetical protein [Archaeoglobus sp.]MBO8179794.1 hypothetical protein [Archaeoglobus sp.]
MRAEEISKKVNIERLATSSGEISAVGMDMEFAAKLKELVDFLVPAEKFQGYLSIDGEYVVFRRDGRGCILAIVEEERVRWCLKKLEEVLNGS